jgi:UDP-N-acetyl-D-mannosaminuronic acid dehydrogenase
LLATKGHSVRGVDVRGDVIETINRGEIHLVEPDLDLLVRSAVHSGNLVAADTPEPSDVFILAVPTPFKDDKQPDLTFVAEATRAIEPHLRAGCLVILESTSPVGTTEAVAAQLAKARPDLCTVEGPAFFVAHCPERVLPGHILRELVENDRVVGGVNPASTHAAAAFYRSFVRGEVLETTSRTAEMTKLAENSYRDVNIAFANELSMICDSQGISVTELIGLANRHPRVDILRPGPGVGGHCIAVDPWFIVAGSPDTSHLIRTAREVNVSKEHWVVAQVITKAEAYAKPRIACLGLAYKPDVDDLRESPALHIAMRLRDHFGADAVVAVEPNITQSDALQLVDLDTALRDADIVLALVAHREFRAIKPSHVEGRVVIDTCGVFS